MLANTWTPTALASEAHPWRGSGWRAIEAQHRVATLVLTGGNVDDQALLEEILEEVKPPIPASADGLHWLLATPFRHWPLRGGSRFRRRSDPGVFYGAESRRTAAAEAGYWRLRFWLDSEGLKQRSTTMELTLFEFHAASDFAIDLTRPPLVRDAVLWTHRSDYSATQALAEQARTANIETIRYASVRDVANTERRGRDSQGVCLALLSPGAFKSVRNAYRHVQQGWSVTIAPPNTVVWQRHLEDEAFRFQFAIP